MAYQHRKKTSHPKIQAGTFMHLASAGFHE